MQRVQPQRRANFVTHGAPFMEVVRPQRHVESRMPVRAVVTSPLLRAVAVARARRIPLVYHPRYIAGRVVAVRRNEIIVDPPATTTPVVVREVIVGTAAPAIPVGSVVALPVTYTNGMYQLYAPPPVYTTGYNSYGYAPYGYSNYGYAPYGYAPPVYCNGNSSSLLYAALLPVLASALTGNGSSFNASDLASIALTAAAGGGSCGYVPAGYNSQPYYSQPAYYTPPSYYTPSAYYNQPAYYAPPVNYGYTPGYATPYDNCMSSDDDGDEACVPSGAYNAYSPYNAYGNYGTYGAYTPQQIQGVVIGRSGDMLMVLGSSGTPTFVYAAPALQSGFTANGPVAPGQIIDAYGYYSGNTFIATAIV
jgi:hypothetical protein